MERRLLLSERLKSTKLNKMTIKQGGVNVTLNIKKDIADPNVQISDKVLFMLEAYAEKQNLNGNDLKKDTDNKDEKIIEAKNPNELINASETLKKEASIDEPIKNQSNQTELKDKPMEESFTSNPEKVVNSSMIDLTTKIPIEKQYSSPTKRVCFELSADFTPSRPKTAKSILKNCSVETPKASNIQITPQITPIEPIELKLLKNESPCVNSTSSPSQKPSKRRIEDYFLKLPKEKVLKVSTEIETSTENDQNKSELEQTQVQETITAKLTEDSKETLSLTHQTQANIQNLVPVQEEINKTDIQIDQSLESTQINEIEKEIFESETFKSNLSTSHMSQTEEDSLNVEGKHENDEKSKKSIDSGDSSMFSCRLCKMKLGNQRSLYEHVARVHGGKSGILNLSQMTKSNDENSDLELDNNFNDEDEDMKSEDHVKKNKLAPYPNLAIRVAKVAYYTTKTGPNLKSNVFSHGGIRGNFFSQERLQLRSCRIKMKLIPSDIKNTSNMDKFLSQANLVQEFKSIDRNTTSIVQVSNNDPNHVIIDDIEIKSFFNSILSYIPINYVKRVEDLAKENESWLNQDDLVVLNQIVLEAKQFGINLAQIKKNFEEKRKFKIKFNSFMRLMNVLVENYLVLPVGVVYRVYVAHEFKKHWVISSFKCLKGRGPYKSEEKPEEEESEESESKHNQLTTVEGKRRVSPRKRPDNSLMIESTQKNFKPVCLIPRPWRYIDGLLNRPVLQKMLESVIVFLKNKPNSCLEAVCNNFSPFLQPIMTQELIEMLERLKCVQRVILKKEFECDLFSDFTNGSSRIQESQSDEMNGDEIFSYNSTKNSIFILRQVFPN